MNHKIRCMNLLYFYSLILAIVLVKSHSAYAQEESEISVLSETETAYSGAKLLRNGENIQLGALTEGRHEDLEDRDRYLFWQGDSLFLGVIDTEDNNRLDVVAEFYWFDSSLPRNSDFYVVVLKVTAAPSANTDWRIATPASITDSILFRDIGSVHRVEAAVDRTGDHGAIRWDWSVPFQNYRWEPERVIEVEQEYAAGTHLEGSAMRDLSGGVNVQAKGFLDAQTRVSTRYTITLWRWEMLVQAGATDMDWALVALSPEHEQDPAYHEYFLVLQAERNVPVRLDHLQFATTFRKRALLLDDFSDLSIRLRDIQLSPPRNPCDEGFHLSDMECVPVCPEQFEWLDNRCVPICPEGFELIDNLCTEVCPPEHEREGRDCVRVCLPDQVNVDNVCEVICEDGSISMGGVCSDDVCPDGYHWMNDRCEAICTEDEIWVDQVCIPDCNQNGMIYDGEECVCPADTELRNGRCQEIEVLECSAGQTLQGDQCVSICPDGYLWENGQCQLTCPMGYVVQNARCVPERCPANTRFVNGICVACPADTTLVDNECLACDPRVADCTQEDELMIATDKEGCATVTTQPFSLSLLLYLVLGTCISRRLLGRSGHRI